MKPILSYIMKYIVRGRINQIMILGAPVLAFAMALWMGNGANVSGRVQTSLSMSFIVQLFGIYMALAGVIVGMRGNCSLLWLFDRGYRKSAIIGMLLTAGFPVAFLQSFAVISGLFLTGYLPGNIVPFAVLGAFVQSISVSAAGIFVGTISRDVAVLQWVSLPLLLLGAVAINLAGVLDLSIIAALPFGVGMVVALGGLENSMVPVFGAITASVLWTSAFIWLSVVGWKWSSRTA